MIIFLVALLSLLGTMSREGSEELKRLDTWMQPSGKIKALSTTAMIDDLVKAVGGDAVESVVLITRDLDPHSYEIVKGDAEKFEFADVIFANGLGLEHGASLRYRMQRHKNVLRLGETLDPTLIGKIDGMIDPHIWTDMELFSEVVAPIVEGLSQLRPELSAVFRERGDALREELLAVHSELMEEVAKLPDHRRYLVTSHDAFHYFARKYFCSEERFAAPEGLAPEGQMSASDIKEIIQFLKEHDVRVVFPESNLSQAALNKIQDAYDRVILADTVLYGDAMGVPGSGADTYIGMMRHNVTKICEYLRNESD